MWVHLQSSKPSPTDVESYWCKPKLSNISASRVAKIVDFGLVALPAREQEKVDSQTFLMLSLLQMLLAHSKGLTNFDMNRMNLLGIS